MKPQIFFVHGGMTFKNNKDYLNFLKKRDISVIERKRWIEDLRKKLNNYFEIISPRMPLQDNANYKDWKITFERYFPYLRNNIIFIGSSLGGIFLAKYLSENKFPKKILSAYLIAPPFDNSLLREDLVGGFKLKSDLSLLEENVPNLNLLFSKKDEVVSISHAKKYKNKLKTANIIILNNVKGHFKISKFPKLIAMIKKDIGGKHGR